MLNNFVNFMLKFSLFYDLQQTKRQLLKEFKEELQKEKSLQDPVTKRTYKDLNKIDKIIIDRFSKYYRKGNNAIYLSTHDINYSYGGIYKRLEHISNCLYNNIRAKTKTIQNGVLP